MNVRRLTCLFLLLGLGCSGKQRNEDFVPPDDVARRSLESYLAAWSAGERGDIVKGTTPPVSVADNLRAQGRSLASYTILGPIPADVPRCYAVRLTLTNPPEEIRERYVVVGLDPIWVIRHDDYEKITHWCDPTPPAGKTADSIKK